MYDRYIILCSFNSTETKTNNQCFYPHLLTKVITTLLSLQDG